MVNELCVDRDEASFQVICALHRVGQMVATEDDLGSILTAIVEEAVALLQADAGLIGSWDAEQEVFRDVAACNLPIMFPGREFGARESMTSHVARTGQVVYVEDYATYRYRVPELDCFRFYAVLGVPLLVGSECRGALVVHSLDPHRRFTAIDRELLATFASQAGAAFEKARLYQLALDQLEKLESARMELEKVLAIVVKIQEEERSRIAADMHDGVVQMMVGSLCELQAAMAHFPRAPELVEAKQQRARDLIRDSITELRSVIYDLRPIVLDAAGLVPAVETLVKDLQQGSDVRLRFSVLGTSRRCSPDVEIGAYRIVQEALNNALKHSAAARVEVRIQFSARVLQISVRDDGQGFLVEETTSGYSRSAGLIGMRERARGMGGRLSVVSSADQGTTVTAEIPCDTGAHPSKTDDGLGQRGEVPSTERAKHCVELEGVR